MASSPSSTGSSSTGSSSSGSSGGAASGAVGSSSSQISPGGSSSTGGSGSGGTACRSGSGSCSGSGSSVVRILSLMPGIAPSSSGSSETEVRTPSAQPSAPASPWQARTARPLSRNGSSVRTVMPLGPASTHSTFRGCSMRSMCSRTMSPCDGRAGASMAAEGGSTSPAAVNRTPVPSSGEDHTTSPPCTAGSNPSPRSMRKRIFSPTLRPSSRSRRMPPVDRSLVRARRMDFLSPAKMETALPTFILSLPPSRLSTPVHSMVTSCCLLPNMTR